jgi:Protein of unknown function (DUF1588)
MGRSLRNSASAVAAIGLATLLAACDSSSTGTLTGTPSAPQPVAAPVSNGAAGAAPTSPGSGGVTPGTGGTTGNNGSDPTAPTNVNIDQRVVNYGEALRTASLKLLGDLPTLAQINQIVATTDPTALQTLYGSFIDQFLADPRFTTKMIQYFRDTFKTGQQGTPPQGQPSFDTAATFAAEVVVSSQPYTTIFTATTGTCPTYASGTFTPADCGNGAPTAGVLTDPGLMSQYYADMSFRRVRFIQETFVCSKFPAEYAPVGTPMGAGTYTSPWDFGSITGGATAKINFQDTSSLVCANCHTTLNHIAPLFGHFDMNGQYVATAFQVDVPVPGTPAATLADWLPPGQGFAWRDGTPVTDIPSLGAAIAADPDVPLCAVNRFWDFVMSRGDIVNDLATVPPVVTQPFVSDFTANGMNVKRLLRNMLTSDDFVKF